MSFIYWEKGKGAYRFNFNRIVEGQRVRATKLFDKGWTKRECEEWAAEESKRLYRIAKGQEKPRLSLAGAVDLYIKHHLPTKPKSEKASKDALRYLEDAIGTRMLEDCCDVADEYKAAHRMILDDGTENPEGLADGTVRLRLSILRAAVRWAYKSKFKYGDRDYSDRMVLPEANERQYYMTVEELERLWLAFEDDEARAMFQLAYICGLRWRDELLTRKPEHVVTAGLDEDGVTPAMWLEIGRTKNGKPVMKYIDPAHRQALGFVPFQYSDSWYYERWVKAVAAIGRPEMVPHDLRHCLASDIMAQQLPLTEVAAALHHKSLSSSYRYAHRYPEATRRVLAGAGQRVAAARAAAAAEAQAAIAKACRNDAHPLPATSQQESATAD